MMKHGLFEGPRRAAVASGGDRRRVVLVDLYWTRDKDPRVPLGHASLLSALRAWTSVDVRSVVVPVNGPEPVDRAAAAILAHTAGLAAESVDVAIGVYVWSEAEVQRSTGRCRSPGSGSCGGRRSGAVRSGARSASTASRARASAAGAWTERESPVRSRPSARAASSRSPCSTPSSTRGPTRSRFWSGSPSASSEGACRCSAGPSCSTGRGGGAGSRRGRGPPAGGGSNIIWC
jgi:hypothetical protein